MRVPVRFEDGVLGEGRRTVTGAAQHLGFARSGGQGQFHDRYAVQQLPGQGEIAATRQHGERWSPGVGTHIGLAPGPD